MTDNLPAIPLNSKQLTMEQAMQLAIVLAQSSLVPMSLQGHPQNILLIMMRGAELDLTPAQSISLIYSPSSGRTELASQLVLAKLREAGHDYEYELDDNGCTFTIIRGDNGKPYKAKFTLDNALAAGLVVKKDGKLIARAPSGKPLPWELYREDLFFARAATRAVRRGAPEVTLGFVMQGGDDGIEPADAAQVILQPQAPPIASGGGEGQLERSALPAGPQGQPQVSETEAAPPDVAAELAELEAAAAPTVVRERPEGLTEGVGELGPLANRTQQEQVAEKFKALGWDLQTYKADVLQACTYYCRRPISSAAKLTVKEAVGLAAELSRLIRTVDQEYQPVALADLVGKWKEAADDPDDPDEAE